MKCILCESQNTQILESIKANDLIALYKRYFGVDASSILSQDLVYHHCKDCDLRFFSLLDGTIPTGDNEFYNALNKLEWYYLSEKSEYVYAKQFIREDSNVLEVGCGSCAFTKFIPQTARYVGLEFSTDAIKMAKEGINILNTSIEEFAMQQNQAFDIACSFQVFEHVASPRNFIKSQIACLDKLANNDSANGGGHTLIDEDSIKHSNSPNLTTYNPNIKEPLLIIAVPSEDSFLQYCVNGVLNMPPHHISRFSDKCLQNIAHIFNLELVSLFHESVQSEHILFYKSVMWAKKFLPTPLIDRGIMRTFVKILGVIARRFIKIPANEIGHTVVAVYRLKH